MACSRKALASGYNCLSKRFQLSFLHIIHDDREISERLQTGPISPSPLIRRAFSYSRPLGRCRSLDRDWRRIGFSLPFGVDQSSRSFSTRSEELNAIGYLNDVADVMTDAGVNTGIMAAASSVPAPFPGEVAAAAADSFLPVAALQHLIDVVHSLTGLNWWASIALTSVLIRGATVPLLINQLKATIKLNTIRPELEKLKEELNNHMNQEAFQENQKRMKALFKNHGVTPFTPLKGLLIQGPVFISFFMAISNMVEKVPSFKGGGAYWFTDLTTPDAMYILPVLTALTFLANVELNMQEGLEGNPMANTMKKFFRGLGLLAIPFTAGFPKAIFCYWMTSNLFSLVYGFALKQPPVRKFLVLPDASQIKPEPALPISTSTQEKGSEQTNKSPQRRVSSSTLANQRIKNLEKTLKQRIKNLENTVNQEKGSEQTNKKYPQRRLSSSTRVSRRIKNLEKTLKQEKGSKQTNNKSPERNVFSSTYINQRFKNLEKFVKSQEKVNKKRRKFLQAALKP